MSDHVLVLGDSHALGMGRYLDKKLGDHVYASTDAKPGRRLQDLDDVVDEWSMDADD